MDNVRDLECQLLRGGDLKKEKKVYNPCWDETKEEEPKG